VTNNKIISVSDFFPGMTQKKWDGGIKNLISHELLAASCLMVGFEQNQGLTVSSRPASDYRTPVNNLESCLKILTLLAGLVIYRIIISLKVRCFLIKA